MGQSGTVPSAILAGNIPEALSPLTSAINAEKSQPASKHSDGVAVSMAHRALPLIDLRTAAAKEGYDVMWK